MKLRPLFRLVLVSGLLLPPIAVVHADDVAGVVDARQAGFKDMGKAMKAISAEIKSGTMDRSVMTTSATAIGAHTDAVKNWFPAGSGPESGLDTDALAYIWKNPDKFASIADQLGPALAEFESALADGDDAAVQAKAKQLSGVCSDCHRSFRAD